MPVDMRILKLTTGAKKGLFIRVRMWNAGKKQACAVTTFKSLISNMITGVTEVS
jgi:ribosomal protein L6P/L9E